MNQENQRSVQEIVLIHFLYFVLYIKRWVHCFPDSFYLSPATVCSQYYVLLYLVMILMWFLGLYYLYCWQQYNISLHSFLLSLAAKFKPFFFIVFGLLCFLRLLLNLSGSWNWFFLHWTFLSRCRLTWGIDLFLCFIIVLEYAWLILINMLRIIDRVVDSIDMSLFVIVLFYKNLWMYCWGRQNKPFFS